jgi:hypothetical protein
MKKPKNKNKMDKIILCPQNSNNTCRLFILGGGGGGLPNLWFFLPMVF